MNSTFSIAVKSPPAQRKEEEIILKIHNHLTRYMEEIKKISLDRSIQVYTKLKENIRGVTVYHSYSTSLRKNKFPCSLLRATPI